MRGTIEDITKSVREALRGFVGEKLTPNTMDAVRLQLSTLLREALDVNVDDHFTVISNGSNVIIPKTEFATKLVNGENP